MRGDLSSVESEAIIVAQYLLSPDIPKPERKHFEKYYLMFSKIMALGNIKKQEILSYLIAFEKICMLLEMGLFETARQNMARQMMKMQLSRSVGGFHTIWTSGGYSRQEQISETLQQMGEDNEPKKIKRLFTGRRKKK